MNLASPGNTTGFRRDTLVCLGLALVTLAVFWPVWQFEFTNFDDYHMVLSNPRVREGLTFANIWWALGTTYSVPGIR